MHTDRPDFSRRALLATGALILLSVLFCAMLLARMVYVGDGRYRFFVWNLFLAWVPFATAFLAYRLHRYAEHSSLGRRALVLPLLAVWLIFFPNAPYVTTDLIHWRQGSDLLAFYDLVMILLFVVTGLMLGAISLYLAHSIVHDTLGRWAGWLFAAGACAAAAIGIYIGRFLRWNSWDIVLNPDDVMLDVLSRAIHARPIAFTVAMAAFVFCVYVLVNALAGGQHFPRRRSGR